MKTSDLTSFIKNAMAIGSRTVYFRDVIKIATGHEILELEGEYLQMAQKIKATLRNNLGQISEDVKKNYTGRANELGNFLEPLVRDYINRVSDFHAATPFTSGGRRQAAGYPDITVKGEGKTLYVDCKIFQRKTKESSLRAFYFKPSERNKITESCPHVLIGFEVEAIGGGNKSPFVVNDFKIVDLYDLQVNFKPEFNANNPMIYRQEAIVS